MSTGMEKLFVHITCFIGAFGITLHPSPTANCTRYNSLILTCSISENWNFVTFNLQNLLGTENIAAFINEGSSCKDNAAPTPGLYQTSCNFNSKTFYLTINNVTDTYNAKFVECTYLPGAGRVQTTINVQYVPTSSPSITQLPNRPIIEGNKVTLTCKIFGGNPLATIVWQCTGFTTVISTGTPPTDEVVSSIEHVVNREDNGKECVCTGKHHLWTIDQFERHTLDVYFQPATFPLIIQTPQGTVNNSDSIVLTCSIQGGNPLAVITWQCRGYVPVTPTGSPSASLSVSNIQLTVNIEHNGAVCTCIGTHPAWNQSKRTDVILDVRYAPTSSPKITHMPTGPINEGDTVTLTCKISIGNPLATIVWQCSGFDVITPTVTPPTDESVSMIRRVVTKDDNDRVCVCIGKHLLWDDDKKTRHTLDVYFQPTTNMSIIQTPPGPVNDSNRIILTCEIQGGYPLATITWNCTGSSAVTPPESSKPETSLSSVQLIVSKDSNGAVCICQGSHPVWKENRMAYVTLDVRYAPTSSPIIIQTPNGSIHEGNKVTLTCKISGGNPLATIVWNCSGFSLVISTGSPLPYEAVSSVEHDVTKDDNAKECLCIGKHFLWIIDTVARHTLDIYYKPTVLPLITQTPPGPVNDSDRIILSCEIQGGNPLAVITWKCGGSIPVTPTGSTKPETAVSNVQLTASKDRNGNVCTCKGFHPVWDHYKTANVTLDIRYAPQFPPSIVKTPEGQIVEGNNVTLTCKISRGNPLATIVWQCAGFEAVNQESTLSTDEVMSTLKKVVTKHDNGKECVCTGKHLLWLNDMKHTYKLTVYYSTSIHIANVQPINVVQNNSIILVCEEIDGNPKNASFQWYKDNHFIRGTSNFSITEAKANDTGNYTCQGSNGFGEDSAKVEVYVLYSPRVYALTGPDGNTIAENETIVFICSVQSYPPANITWVKHGSNLTFQSKGNEFISFLTIEHASCLNTGNYTCRATNTINGYEYSSMKDIELFVTCSPRLYNLQESSSNIIGLPVGQNLTLSKHILSYPKGHVEWLFQHKTNSSQTSIQSALVCSTDSVFEHHICFIKVNLTETDFGLYSVIVMNDIGKSTFTFNVNPQGPPYESSNVNVTCGVLKADISWLTGYNGGEEQVFYITSTDNEGHINMHRTGLVGMEKAKIKKHSLQMPAGLFRFDIFGNNTFGNATVKGILCEVQGLNANDSVVSLAAGLGSCAAVLAIIIVAVVFVVRKRLTTNKEDDTKALKRSGKQINDDNDDELKDNPLYVTSNINSDWENGPVYSVVDKSKKTGSAQPINANDVYSEVQKTEKKGKHDNNAKNILKAAQQGNNSIDIEMESVLTNADHILQDDIKNSIYANTECQSDRMPSSAKMHMLRKNKDGLIYADLDLDPSQTGTKYVIRGLENKTNYAIIDLNVKVDPLPSDDDDDNDEDGDKKKE